jgi:hypothetical protein
MDSVGLGNLCQKRCAVYSIGDTRNLYSGRIVPLRTCTDGTDHGTVYHRIWCDPWFEVHTNHLKHAVAPMRFAVDPTDELVARRESAG